LIAIFFTANKKANNKNKTPKSINGFGFLQPQIDVKIEQTYKSNEVKKSFDSITN
jgi:hypothetical protein